MNILSVFYFKLRVHLLKTFILFVLSICCITNIKAQNTIEGNITGENEEKIQDYHILILNKVDSSIIVAKSFTSENFSIEKPKTESILKITCIGYQDTTIYIPIRNSNINLGKIVLHEKDYILDEVTIKAKAPFMTRSNDKLVYNVENSTISNAGTAIDVLYRTPYIIMSPEGLINVAGKSKTLLLLNNRPIQRNEELQLLNSSKIKQVIIIENPSAKYDAEGHSIINIITKKGLKEGIKSSIYFSYKQGKRASWYFSPELSYKIKKVAINASLGANLAERKGNNQTWMRYEKENYSFSSYTYDINRIKKLKSISYNLSLDYLINKKSNLNIYADGNLNESKSNVLSNMEIKKNSHEYPILQMLMKDNSTPKQNSFGINYDFKSSKGFKLSLMNNYTNYKVNTDSYIEETNSSNKNLMKSSFINEYNLFLSKIDISIPFSYLHGYLEFGGKYSYIKSNNNIDFKKKLNEQWAIVPTFSNKVDFDETIIASYILFSGKKDKWSYSLGVRAESTWTKNNSNLFNKHIHKDSKLLFFPNLSLSYQPNEQVNYRIGYSERVSRPSYSSLNSSVLYIDSLSTKKGNPYLQATIYKTFSASMLWKRKVNLSFSYSYINSPQDMLFINDKLEIEKYTVIFQNVKDTRSFSLNLGGNFRYKFWTTQPSFSFSYRPVTIVDDSVNYTFKHSMYMFRSINQFALYKDWSFDVDFLFQQPAYSYKKFGKQINLDIGISKDLFNKKLRIKANIHNAFRNWTQSYNYSYKDSYVIWEGNNQHFFNISIRYNFTGNKFKVKKRKPRSEELNRM